MKKTILVLILSFSLLLCACNSKDTASSNPITDAQSDPLAPKNNSGTNTNMSTQTSTSINDENSSYTTAPSTEIDNEWALFLVNNQNPLPENFNVATAEIIDPYTLDSRAAPYFFEMKKAAEKDGINVVICSAYRSVSYQKQLFDGRVDEFLAAGYSQQDAEREVLKYTAYPGKSEHNTGLAIDFYNTNTGLTDDFENTELAKWLYENSYKYGFILRYPRGKTQFTEIEYEPWHFRFIGVYHATKIHATDMCLEEYVASLKR